VKDEVSDEMGAVGHGILEKSQARHNRSAGNRWTRDSFVLLVGVRLGIVVWSYGAWYSAVFVFVLLVKL
jgi:hypothetical protein